MSVFTQAELDFLHEKGLLARLGTIGPDGGPQVRPVGYLVDADNGTIDVPGRANPTTRKWRNLERDPRVSLVIDDFPAGADWPRVLEIRGTAELLPDTKPATDFPGVAPGVIRIHPRRILSIVDGTENNRSVPEA